MRQLALIEALYFYSLSQFNLNLSKRSVSRSSSAGVMLIAESKTKAKCLSRHGIMLLLIGAVLRHGKRLNFRSAVKERK